MKIEAVKRLGDVIVGLYYGTWQGGILAGLLYVVMIYVAGVPRTLTIAVCVLAWLAFYASAIRTAITAERRYGSPSVTPPGGWAGERARRLERDHFISRYTNPDR